MSEIKINHEPFKQDFSNDELKQIIKELLEFIDVPDEPKFQTAVYYSAEQGLMNAANRVIKLKKVVSKARSVK